MCIRLIPDSLNLLLAYRYLLVFKYSQKKKKNQSVDEPVYRHTNLYTSSFVILHCFSGIKLSMWTLDCRIETQVVPKLKAMMNITHDD